MKKTIGIGATLLILSPLATVVACGNNDEDPSKIIAVLVSSKSNPFFQQIIDSARTEAAKHGYTVKDFDSEDDASKETGNIDTIITKGYAGVIWNPINSTGSKAAGTKLKNSKIPFTLVDRTIDDFDGNMALVATDNVVATKNVVADSLAKLNSTDQIVSAHLQGNSGSAAQVDRSKGFADAMTKWNTDHSTAQLDLGNPKREDFADFKIDTAQAKISSWKANSTLEYIFAENDQMALGASKAYEGQSTYPMIVGFDGLAAAKTAVDSGKLYATVEQDTEKMGALSAQIIIEKLTSNNDLTTLSDYTKLDQDIALDGIIYKNDKWPNAK